MTPQAVVFDIGNVLIEWQPERFYDSVIGEDRRRAMFDAVDLHGMNDRVDSGENFRDTIYARGSTSSKATRAKSGPIAPGWPAMAWARPARVMSQRFGQACSTGASRIGWPSAMSARVGSRAWAAVRVSE